jgi:hypothetical protein
MVEGMDIAVNEDWASARRRLEAFWEREIIDRPCLQVYVPSRPETLEIDVEAERYWNDRDTWAVGIWVRRSQPSITSSG